jgi:ankyrin repeat protein
MKIVREHINEKFVEDSDPVTDMGIGTRAQISRWMEERRQLDTDDNALVLCAAHGKLEWVKFLIAAGADVHYWYDYALRWAAENGHLEIVKELLKAGADVHAKAPDSPAPSALKAAQKQGHQDVVNFLEDYMYKEKTKNKR